MRSESDFFLESEEAIFHWEEDNSPMTVKRMTFAVTVITAT